MPTGILASGVLGPASLSSPVSLVTGVEWSGPLVSLPAQKLRLPSRRPLQLCSEQSGGTSHPQLSSMLLVGRQRQKTCASPDVLVPAVLQAFASPLSGLVGDKYDRAKIVAGGCFLWGIMTSAVGLSTSLGQV